ncbi:kinase-associated lipoprotein B [Terribacillus sp. DMT04]|uniref:kinase-associated lipoprotein B n=1 Tax=Terribacillus sp. DMT04 TaxID=2850441 RepID=UPI001C2BD2CE|nr:kinase-associated lipoprotein B [Terribacillus sp. DMT04]QXE00781.1 kinase-associated lipoprotein B [Terribacillus sp. DMT04]
MISIGSIVKARYKTGSYVGKVKEERGKFLLVEILAVLKHPQQGDLHNPKQTEDVFFHERRALAHYEKANIPKTAVSRYEEEVLDYADSLRTALEQLQQTLHNEPASAYQQLALANLASLEKDYFG